ncbi:MAG TPA: hypothetical protein VFA26_14510 [Gemmataceae bacterium]|nr:hypothetical protein [Gemmataceae bacterium]
MKAASLFGVFLVAKAIVVAAVGPPLSGWAPLAYLWQDALFVLAFAGVDLALRRRPWAGWCLYVVVVLYVAVNVPAACQLATPLTWPLLRAARPTLADSISHHVTPANVLRLAAVLATAAGLPLVLARFWHRLPPRLPAAAAVVLLALTPFGPLATASPRSLRPAPQRLGRPGRHRPASRGRRRPAGGVARQPLR